MYFAFKYARKKYQQRQAREAQQAGAGTASDAPDQANDKGGVMLQPLTPVDDSPRAVDVLEAGDAMTPPAEETKGEGSRKKKEKKKKELTPEEAAEKKRRRKYRLRVLFGLFMPFTLQALDMTIVASALPFIAADFDEISQLNWIISAFNLTSAAFLPFWAQIADIFGRLATILLTIVIVAVGSAICTGAPTTAFGVLLLGRALQGVGASGVNICVRTILADGVSLADYALNWTLFALISAASFSVGPVIGGYLTQDSWRWCFAINLPVAVAAVALVLLLLRNDLLGPQPLPELESLDAVAAPPSTSTSTRRGRFAARLSTIDLGGQLLFLWGLGLLILALTWAGGSYPWASAQVLAPLVVGAVLSAAWVGYEYLMAPGRALARLFPAQRAMMPWALLSQRDIGLLFVVNFGIGMAMFAVLYFMDLYFALVRGNDSSTAGVALLYFLPGLGAGAYMAMFASNVWPRQTLPSLLLGGATSAVGITVLAWQVGAAAAAESDAVVYGMMALTGHGVGMRMNPGSLHGLAFFPAMTAAITCVVAFAMPFGGTVALTLMSTVFNNKSGGGTTLDDARAGIRWAFVSLIPFMWLCLLATTFLGNVWILRDGGHEVVHGAYLWSLLTRRGLPREHRARGDLGPQA